MLIGGVESGEESERPRYYILYGTFTVLYGTFTVLYGTLRYFTFPAGTTNRRKAVGT